MACGRNIEAEGECALLAEGDRQVEGSDSSAKAARTEVAETGEADMEEEEKKLEEAAEGGLEDTDEKDRE